MAKFLKMLGFGVLYTLLSPFIFIFFALYAVYCICIFLYMSIRNLIIFFAGGNPMGDLPEDVKAKKIAQQKMLEAADASEQPQSQTINNVTQNIYQQPVQNVYQDDQQSELNSLPNSVDATPIEQKEPDLIEYDERNDSSNIKNNNQSDDFGGDN